MWRPIEIDLSTLCRCTSLRDRNNELIFENDVIRDEYKPDDIFTGKVIWSKRNLTWDVVEINAVQHIPLIEFTAEDNLTCKTLVVLSSAHDENIRQLLKEG